jgi:CopG family transcriptional regulator/antitoxin EndoAI
MNCKLSISLPEETIRMIDGVIKDGDRDRFINKAVQYYINQKIERKAVNNLREQLKEGAIQNAERDLELVEDYL